MVLCVTGPMAAGKNSVCDILRDAGFAVLDCDKVVHDAVEAQRGAILSAFEGEASARGIRLTDGEGRIVRRSLSALVFESDENLAKQERIVFPYVDGVIQKFIKDNSGRDIAINAVVLYKVKSIAEADAVLYVCAPRLLRLLRVCSRDGLPLRNAARRFRAQRGLLARYKATGLRVVKVRNCSGLRALRARTDAALKLLNK